MIPEYIVRGDVAYIYAYVPVHAKMYADVYAMFLHEASRKKTEERFDVEVDMWLYQSTISKRYWKSARFYDLRKCFLYEASEQWGSGVVE